MQTGPGRRQRDRRRVAARVMRNRRALVVIGRLRDRIVCGACVIVVGVGVAVALGVGTLGELLV